MPRGRVGSGWMLIVMACACSADPAARAPGTPPSGPPSSIAGRGGGGFASGGAAAATGQGFGNADSGTPIPAASRAGAAAGMSGAMSSMADAAVGDGGSSPSACAEPAPEPAAAAEICGNGLDDDHNGFIDESCPCTSGATQRCFGGPIARANAPECTKGTQTCIGEEFTGWGACEGWTCGPTTPPPEQCDNDLDDDCDGQVDEGCVLDVPVNIDGDCIAVSCPPQAPYPVGCDLSMEGDDSRGCVANMPGSSSVYFQEGDQCPLPPPFDFGGAGHISGTLLCSIRPPSMPLGASSCAIDKQQPIYATDPSGCPQP